MRSRHVASGIAICAAALVAPLAASASGGSSLTISTFAGDGSDQVLHGPNSVAPAPNGGYLVADTLNNRIQRVTRDGAVTTVAGSGASGFNGDSIPPTSAKLNQPTGVAATSDGGFLIADSHNNRIRKVMPGFGTIVTVAGAGTAGYSGDGAAATLAQLNHPDAVAVTPDGGFLIADEQNNSIRKVDSTGTIATVAGDSGGVGGYAGDGGSATSANLSHPHDVAVTSDGGVLIADTDNDAIRKVGSDGLIQTVAGTATTGFTGDGGDPLSAELAKPAGVAVLPNGGFLVADSGNDVVRKVSSGTIDTEIGTGSAGFAGDGGPAGSAELKNPTDVLPQASARLVADSDNNRIRLVGVLPAVGFDPLPGSHPIVPTTSSGSGSGSDLPAAAPPKIGRRFEVEHRKGHVRVKLPKSPHYVSLTDAASIPVGTVIDARRGRLTLTSARNSKGTLQTADFSGAFFRVTQRRSSPVTQLALRGGDFSGCRRPTAHRAVFASASRRRRIRRLWGSGHGHFRTRGRHGAATVRGTIWITEDSCAGTRVTVRRGLVAVRDFRRKRTVMVRKGHSYLARVRAPRNRR